jgi:surface-anchored protein
MKYVLSLVLSFVALVSGPVCHADILFTGGGADLTFYYESVADRWDVVFRQKGDTVATGLNSQYTGFTGIVGLNPSQPDFNFNTKLTTQFITDRFVTVGSTTFAVARASGSPFNLPSNFATNVSPDLGIRTRLREDQVALGNGTNTAADQFDSFNLTLNLTNSTFNNVALDQAGSPFVSLLNWSGTNPVPLINSESNLLTANFQNYAHVHRNWGFSQSGIYDLSFDIQGVGGTYGDTASVGSFNMTFNVSAVPEPSSMCLVAATMGLAAWRLRRRRTLSPDDEATPTV